MKFTLGQRVILAIIGATLLVGTVFLVLFLAGVIPPKRSATSGSLVQVKVEAATATLVPTTKEVVTKEPIGGTSTPVPFTTTPKPTTTSATAKPTATPIPATAETPTPVVTTEVLLSGSWTVEYFKGATDQMRDWKFKELVMDWSVFPNEDFPKYQFLAKDGVEYGMAESAYCQRATLCDINTPAMHYRAVSGNYNIPTIDDCTGEEGVGCAIMLINVGTVTAMYRESSVDYGFTVEGRYWNGDAMPVTVHALLSHVAYNMLNLGATLGPITFPVNRGANCSTPFGCEKVRLVFAVISGNELLVKGVTTVRR